MPPSVTIGRPLSCGKAIAFTLPPPKSGTSKGAFFHHFDSKAALARALVDRYAAADIAHLDQAVAQVTAERSTQSAANDRNNEAVTFSAQASTSTRISAQIRVSRIFCIRTGLGVTTREA